LRFTETGTMITQFRMRAEFDSCLKFGRKRVSVILVRCVRVPRALGEL
jgi:hypothetical protein